MERHLEPCSCCGAWRDVQPIAVRERGTGVRASILLCLGCREPAEGGAVRAWRLRYAPLAEGVTP